MKKLFFYGICIVLALVLCSCAAIDGNVATNLEILTSDELSGRLCIAEGAQKTAAFLAEKLEAAGMEPYSCGYTIPFIYTLPVPSTVRLVIYTEQGKTVLIIHTPFCPRLPSRAPYSGRRAAARKEAFPFKRKAA